MQKSIRHYLAEKVAEAARACLPAGRWAAEQVKLEHPELEAHGDYSSNIALILEGGRLLAEKIKDEILRRAQNDAVIAKVEVAGPGFVNIWLQNDYLVKELERVITQGREYGKLISRQKRRVMVEFGQPNTHKLPHIGHLFSYIYGEAVCRLLLASGIEVWRVNYQGDVGLHVAKCLWAYMQGETVEPKTLDGKVRWLQEKYQEGSKAYEESEQAKREMGELNGRIYRQKPDVWRKTRQWSLDYYQQFEARIGVKYDGNYFESEVADEGKRLAEANVGKVFEQSQGAIVYQGSHTRVFVTSEGNPTYEAKDLALEIKKMQDWPCDLLVITTAAEQNDYFKVVFEAVEKVEPRLKDKLKHIGFGMINLARGKMASRTGNIIGAVDLVEEVVRRVREKSNNAEVAEKVGLAAVKYAFLKKGAAQDMAFDIESSVSIEGNSGPYLQYTYARTRSVLTKGELTPNPSLHQREGSQRGELNEEERAVLRWICRFPEVVEEAANRYAPNLVCNFLYELAQRFNTFYNQHSILSADSEAKVRFRLLLTAAVGQVIKNGLYLLGIEAPDRM